MFRIKCKKGGICIMNKAVIWLIVALFVISIGVGAFSIVLNDKIGTLDSNTQAFKAYTTDQFGTVKSDVSSFKADTANKFTGVQNDITGVQNSFTSLNSDLSAFKSDTTTKLNSAQSSINNLNTDVANIGTQLDESTMNVRQIYNKVIGSVCQIIGDVALGSGFVYSADGYIVTCWHVVNGQSYLDVKLHDGRVAEATVVGSDRASDVAVLKIHGFSDLTPLTLVDSNTLVCGEPIIIVGNPLGIFETVVSGVISRIGGGGYVGGVGYVANLIQYDAAQNHGNSGGPVFDNKGQVIGIAESGESNAEGVKYAVSSNRVKRVAQAIIDNGSFTNATLPGNWLIWNMSPEKAIDLGLDTCLGFWFETANNVGQVQANDVVTAINGVTIRDFADFISYIGEYSSVGDTVILTVIRNGYTTEATVTLIAGWIE
jgi:putative serine protease PepD